MQAPRTKHIRISAADRARVRKESRALGLSQSEYLSIVCRLAESIRASTLPEGLKDPSTIRALMDNPLWLPLITGMASTVLSSIRGDAHETAQPSARVEPLRNPRSVEPLPAPMPAPERPPIRSASRASLPPAYPSPRSPFAPIR